MPSSFDASQPLLSSSDGSNDPGISVEALLGHNHVHKSKKRKRLPNESLEQKSDVPDKLVNADYRKRKKRKHDQRDLETTGDQLNAAPQTSASLLPSSSKLSKSKETSETKEERRARKKKKKEEKLLKAALAAGASPPHVLDGSNTPQGRAGSSGSEEHSGERKKRKHRPHGSHNPGTSVAASLPPELVSSFPIRLLPFLHFLPLRLFNRVLFYLRCRS